EQEELVHRRLLLPGPGHGDGAVADGRPTVGDRVLMGPPRPPVNRIVGDLAVHLVPEHVAQALDLAQLHATHEYGHGRLPSAGLDERHPNQDRTTRALLNRFGRTARAAHAGSGIGQSARVRAQLERVPPEAIATSSLDTHSSG